MPTPSAPPFQIIDAGVHSPSERRAQLLARQRAIPPSLGSLERSAKDYRPSPQLRMAINVALNVGAPLLLTGEPGTGKTQVAHYIAWYFGLESPLTLDVKSSTTAADLLYRFDNVAYFAAAQGPAGASLDKRQFVEPGPLWKAIKSLTPTVVLIDEVDKAPRDFPNDLLGVLDQSRFHVSELSEQIERGEGNPRPIVVITSNSERRLPEPFLRRCIVHHLTLTEELVRSAVAARSADFGSLDRASLDNAVVRFLELRQEPLRKKPALAELLVWLTLLASGAAQGDDLTRLRTMRLGELPALGALIKDRDDMITLESS